MDEWAEETTHSAARGAAPVDKPTRDRQPAKETPSSSANDFWGFSPDPQTSLAGFYSDDDDEEDEEDSFDSDSDE